MKLSEAIRLGAMLHKQGFGVMVLYDGGVLATCALGAAQQAGYTFSGKDWSRKMAYRYRCPTCREGWPALEMITHLNDWHKWTREQIADWVATIEPQEAVSPIETPTLVETAPV